MRSLKFIHKSLVTYSDASRIRIVLDTKWNIIMHFSRKFERKQKRSYLNLKMAYHNFSKRILISTTFDSHAHMFNNRYLNLVGYQEADENPKQGLLD